MCSNKDLIYKEHLPASQAAENSASVVDNAIVGWNLVLYNTAPPAIKIVYPEVERRCFLSPPQSASTKVVACVGCASNTLMVISMWYH